MISNVNRRAFYATIGRSEGTITSSITAHDGYDVIVTGVDDRPEIFTDFSVHPFEHGRPPKPINHAGLASTASGRYQILLRFWLHYKALLHLPDFSPASQDRYVDQQLKERNALALVDAGHFDEAVEAVSGLWASFPGKTYVGQGQRTITALRGFYQASGGVIVA